MEEHYLIFPLPPITSNCRVDEEAWYLLKAGELSRAHTLIVDTIAPNSIINGVCLCVFMRALYFFFMHSFSYL